VTIHLLSILVFVNILLQIETIPVQMHFLHFYPAVLVTSKVDYWGVIIIFFFKFWYCIFRPMALPSSRPATAKRSSINKRFGYQNNSSARALYNTVCRAPRSSNLKWPFPGVHEEGERKTAWWSFLAIFLKMNTLLRIQLLGKNSKYVKITPMDSFKGRFLTTFFLNVFLAFFSTFFFLDFFLTFFRDCAWKLSHNILCNDHNWLEAETDQPFLTC